MTDNSFNDLQNFINLCDTEIANGIFRKEHIKTAREYLKKLEFIKETYKNMWVIALEQKLKYFIDVIRVNNIEDKTNISKMDALTLIENNNIADYVITMIKEKRLTDSLLIARFAYIELSKYLYYDISYTQIKDEVRKSIIVNTPCDPEHTKIFSYVVCTQWLELYSYIMKQFGIRVIKTKRENENHVWGEIELDNDNIIIVDATDYIGSSIDLSNAKSVSPTKGFFVLPKEYSQIRLYDVYNNPQYKNILDDIKKYNELNRELDITLGYIDSDGYTIEQILRNNPLFNYKNIVIENEKDAIAFLKKTKQFFLNLSLPNNIDGYETFAYYYSYIENLPINIRGNISMKTLFVDSFDYKQKLLKKKYLNAPEEYLKYLEDLVYSRYYEYFKDKTDEKLFELIKDNKMSLDEISDIALKEELKIAEINRRLNPYYAINSLAIYNPYADEEPITLLYEPASGKKLYKSLKELQEFKRENNL